MENGDVNWLWKCYENIGSFEGLFEFCDLEFEVRLVSFVVFFLVMWFWCIFGVGREFDLISFGVLLRGREKEKKRIMNIY